MCKYYLTTPLCGHTTLLAGPSCYALFAQLQRINNPVERARPGLPFDVPPACLPNPWNINVLYTGDYCCVECRNNGSVGWVEERRGFGEGGQRGWCGERDARFGPGSERIGVGWRC
ncbi:hypothetical protein GLAREA_01883 [Glarea lozoyensis ATCC 20868]|uniref:Uncharacterized protein n=1 Tax=Glarea lozoyensis (strain ATCC 20868 / MF5171) TaxID=1116229 RepID=S3D1Q6_GLAL2|nr:uncharacterized protein GLAREA_01883 [Glarea lozoyensis ATCC 20868]EPE25971.1 hypothetical protein GLAREA_01883 [Glarea lozoyensis ATCC 20868]